MKRYSFAFAYCVLLGQFAIADDGGMGTTAASAASLPLQVPASARNAAEAPRWDTPAAGSPANTAASNIGPANSVPAPLNSSNPISGAPGANGTNSSAIGGSTSDETQLQKPLQSVMKRRPSEAAVDNGAVQATYNQAVANAGAVPAQAAAPVASQPAAAGATAPALFPGIQAGAVSQSTGVSPAANTAPAAARTATPPAAPATVSGIRPSAIDPAQLAAAKAAADLLASSTDYSATGTTSLRLVDVIAQTTELDRVAAIREYWNLARAWSDRRFAIDEAKRLEAVVPTRGAVDLPMLSTARAAATARMNEAQLNVESAQAALMRTARLAPQNGTYFPTDAPLVGPYQTYFSTLFAGRAAPGRTWQIDRMLPIRLKTINDRTAAVQSAASAVHYAEEAHARGEVDMRTVLACHDQLHEQRRAFLNAVNEYNVEIAEYAATVAGSAAPDRLVAMLIHVKPAERVSAVPGRTLGTIQLPPPPNSNTNGSGTAAAGNGANSGPNTSSSDGWVPSTARNATPAAESSQIPNRALPPAAGGSVADPFSTAR